MNHFNYLFIFCIDLLTSARSGHSGYARSNSPWEDIRVITVLFCRLGLHSSPYAKLR